MRTYLTAKAALELGNALLDAVELARDSKTTITIERTGSAFVACVATADESSFMVVLPPDEEARNRPKLQQVA